VIQFAKSGYVYVYQRLKTVGNFSARKNLLNLQDLREKKTFKSFIPIAIGSGKNL